MWFSFFITWEQRKFESLAETRRGLTYNPSNISPHGIRVLRSSNINEDTFVLSDDDVFVCPDAVKIECVKPNDILITAANGSTRLVGKHAIIVGIRENEAVHGGFMLVASSSMPFFLNAAMSAPWYLKFINLFVAGGNGAIGNLNKNDLDNQLLFVPKNAEQEQIGEFFRNLDNLITLHQRKQKDLFFLILSKKLSLILANDWEQRKARELFDSYADKGHPELPVLSATQDAGMVKRDEIGKSVFHDKSNEVGYKRVLPGQFVIHLRSFQGGFAHSNIEGITSPAYTIFGFKPSEKQYDLFWKYIFSSEEFVRRLETVTYGIRDGRSISYDEFLTMGFIVPSYAEQVKIAQGLIITDNLITLHQCKRAAFFDWKRWLYSKFEESKITLAWEQCKFEEYFEERNERSGEGELISVTINSGIKKFNELGRFDTKPEDLSKYKRVEVGDIAYNSMRMWQGASGYSPYSGILSPAYTVISPKTGVSSLFFAYLIKRPQMIHLFEINSQGLTSDTWNLKFPAFSQIEASAPTEIAEQKNIAEIFTVLDNLITLHQRGEKINNRRQT